MDSIPQSPLPEKDAERLVVLVEDEESVRKYIRHLLTSQGYFVTSFSKASDALKWVLSIECRVPLMITDIRLTGMTGKELADEVCRLKPDTKVLFISASSPYSLEELNPCSNQDGKLLSKPFSPPELLERVNQICGYRGDSAP
jgi:two-component system cell cycle sensor histidine kinase/response regulator CckA